MQNNQAADAWSDVNHYKLSDATANKGKHKFVELPETVLIPAGLVAGEGTLYTKTSGTPAASTLFYTPEATGNEYQLTRTITASFGRFSTNGALTTGNGGWTFLPGGLLLQYGSFDSSVGIVITVTFPVAFTATPYSLVLTGEAGNNSSFRCNIDQGTVTNTQFGFEGTQNTSNFTPVYWMAIGK